MLTMHLRELNVGCVGGGTGLPSLLGGLKSNPWLRLNAVVTMFDSGGSSGQLRDQLGVLPHIVEAILNHVSGHRAGVAGVYNRARYATEMREALQRWAQHVAALTVQKLGKVAA